jgi:hypothetical protein
VCKEIAGVTPDESAMAALTQLEGAADQAAKGQPANSPPVSNSSAGKKKATSSGADEAIDKLLAAHENMQKQQTAVTGPIAKAYETMNKIKTPGTPEAKRFEDVLAKMPEVEAYQRQEKRVQRAKQAVDEAEAELPQSDRSKAK